MHVSPGGLSLLPNFQKGDLTGSQFLEGGCWKRRGDYKSLLNSAYLSIRAGLDINKQQNHFLLPDNQLAKTLIVFLVSMKVIPTAEILYI